MAAKCMDCGADAQVKDEGMLLCIKCYMKEARFRLRCLRNSY